MTCEWIICPQCKGNKTIKQKGEKEERTCDWCSGEGRLYVRISKYVRIQSSRE